MKQEKNIDVNKPESKVDPEIIGAFIAKLRTENDLTQKQLGEKVFMSRKAVSKWETGRSVPTIDTMKMLTVIFKVSLEELLLGRRITERERRRKVRYRFFMKVLKSKWTKVTGIVLSLIVATVFGALMFNKPNDKAYLLSYGDENFNVSNGIIMLSKNSGFIDRGNFYSTYNLTDENTSYITKIFYFDDKGKKNTLITFDKLHTDILDKETRKILKSLIKRRKDIYYNITFTDNSGQKQEMNLRIIYTETTKEEIDKIQESKEIDSYDEEDKIDLRFLFEMNDEEIEDMVDKINKSEKDISLNYETDISNLIVSLTNRKIYLMIKDKKIIFKDNGNQTISLKGNYAFLRELFPENVDILSQVVSLLKKNGYQ